MEKGCLYYKLLTEIKTPCFILIGPIINIFIFMYFYYLIWNYCLLLQTVNLRVIIK